MFQLDGGDVALVPVANLAGNTKKETMVDD
jgi:hypothetical protein